MPDNVTFQQKAGMFYKIDVKCFKSKQPSFLLQTTGIEGVWTRRICTQYLFLIQ